MSGLCVALALPVLAVGGCSGGTSETAAPTATREVLDPAAADQLLASLTRAIVESDAAAAADLTSPDDPATGVLLGDIIDNARVLGLRHVSLETDRLPATDAQPWAVEVTVSWQVAGFDTGVSRADVQLSFQETAGHLMLSGVGGGPSRTPLWLAGPLRVRRSSASLVMAVAPARDLAAWSRSADRAARAVRQVLPSWRAGVVVEVPATHQQFLAALGARAGEFADIAAVTTSVDGSLDRAAPEHIVVNPDVFSALSGRGAQVVLSHEATHVATRAATSRLPLWLVEGFADHVALGALSVPFDVATAPLARLVRRHGVPRGLPGTSQFAAQGGRLGAAYSAAWLACDLLVSRRDAAALTRLYLAVDRGAGLGPELRTRFGLTRPQFTALWRRRVSHWAT